MATGMQLNSAWAKRMVAQRTTLGMVLRREVSMPVEQHWGWMNFYFGVDYAGTPVTKTLTDTLGELMLTSDTVDQLAAAIWAKTLPLGSAPTPTYGDTTLTSDELDVLAHAVWSKTLP